MVGMRWVCRGHVRTLAVCGVSSIGASVSPPLQSFPYSPPSPSPPAPRFLFSFPLSSSTSFPSRPLQWRLEKHSMATGDVSGILQDMQVLYLCRSRLDE